MKIRPIIFLTMAAASYAAAGCTKETTSSANIRTEGIAALIDVTANSAKASTAHVELRVGGSSSNTFVILESGDTLTAVAGEASKAMTAESEGEYEAEFATGAAGTEFKVMFERDEDADALSNRGTLPAPFDITGVPENLPSRTGDDVTIAWDPPEKGSSMHIDVAGSCIFSESIDVPGDSGTYTIKKETLKSTSESMPQDCDVDVTVTRTSTGTADAVFDNESWFRLHQVRTSKFTSKP